MQHKPYYKNKNFYLYQGDSLAILNALPENHFDMIFADPPYFLSGGSFTCQNGKMVSVKKGNWDMGGSHEENFNFHTKWIEACKRVLKPDGTIWISGTYHSIYQCGFALQKNGYHILNEISWFKPNAAPNLSCRFFTASHETLIWARKDKKGKHKFNYRDMCDWGDTHKKYKRCECSKINSIESINEKGKQMRSVWAIGTPKREEKIFGKHPTQKPLDLLKRIILASTNEGDRVLDPFTGSSTTGIASIMHGRKFLGIDIDKDYLDLSIKRFEALG